MPSGPLRIEDFVAQTDGVTLDDLPASAQSRLNAELADLTGGADGSGGLTRRDTDGILVSEDLDGREGFETIADALAGQNLQNASEQTASPPDSGAAILVEPGTYDASKPQARLIQARQSSSSRERTMTVRYGLRRRDSRFSVARDPMKRLSSHR